MKSFSFKQTIFNGIALALPVSVFLYVLFKFLGIFEKFIGPIAKKAGVDSIFGGITIVILSILCMLVLAFLLGLLMWLPFVSKWRLFLQDWIIRLVPSLNHLRLIVAEKLDMENATNQWKPVLLEKGETFVPAYIIEETGEWITLVYVKFPTTEPGSMLITKKSSVKYQEITMKQMKQFNRQFGKGYISLIEGGSAKHGYQQIT